VQNAQSTKSIWTRLSALAIICLLALSVPTRSIAAEKLTSEQVAALVPQLFKLHLKQRDMDVPFMKELLKLYLDHLDPAKSFIIKEEADKMINLPDAELRRLAERSLNADFSHFSTLLRNFLDVNIKRDSDLYANLEKRSDEIKALIKDKKTAATADPVPKDTPKPEGEKKAVNTEAVAEDEDEDKIKWTERPGTHAERETRLLKACAALYRVNKSYLSDVESMKLSLQTMREERDKWLKVKVEEETPKLFLKSFMMAMDPHTVYFDAEEDEEFADKLKASFAGIGVQIRPCPLGAQVEEVIKGGPSERSGKFARGDQIVAVDDFVLAGLTINKIVRRIKGEKGTEVTLRVIKRETNSTETIKLKRDTINLAEMRVKGKKFETPAGTIGMVSVQTFYQGVHRDVKERIKELSKDKPLAGIVLDLRDNHGGYLEEAVELTGLFIAGGPVVGEKDGSNHIMWKDDPDNGMLFSGPMVVLTNQFSASASEIVAGTLKDYGRAVIVGPHQTFGKGTVQRVIPLNNLNLPGEIKITTHQYFLADGGSVQLKGVEPDVVIKGPKLFAEMLERNSENAIPYTKIKGKLDHNAPDVVRWSDYKIKNLSMLQAKSKARVEANQEYKDAFDPKKRKAKFEAKEKEEEAKRNDPNAPPPLPDKDKKDETDYHAEEAVAVLQDMTATWPTLEKQAAK